MEDEGNASYDDAGPFERPEGEIEYLARCSFMFEKLGYLKLRTGENPIITVACLKAMQVDVSTLPPPCQSKNINGHFRRHQFDFLSHLNTVLTVRSSLDDEENWLLESFNLFDLVFLYSISYDLFFLIGDGPVLFLSKKYNFF